MRPQITFPKSLKRALNYHEKKVQHGTAELLHAHSFFKKPEDMNFHDKMDRFEDLMKLNERAANKLIHISINFHPSEKERLTKEFYTHLADEYMHKIGFGDQPYLVYRHEDAGHPHIHVLSTLIQEDGKRISTQYIGRDISEPVRKEMEKQYGFIPADKKTPERQEENQLVVTAQKVQAGKSATMRSITNVLDFVIDQYKYTSIQELNAVLKLFNVKADRGAEDGRIYRNKGLTYVVINSEGQALTKPIKASAFHSKPTLLKLEEKFITNEQKREPDKKHTKNAIDWAMRSKPESLADLAKLLLKERIVMIARQSEGGQIYGITYINHEKKSVFNGSNLGKEYAAKRIIERLIESSGKSRDNQMQSSETRKNQSLQENLKEYDDKKISAKLSSLTNLKKQTDILSKSVEVNKDAGKKNIEPIKENNEPGKEITKESGKIIDRIIGPDYGDSAINKELITDDRKRKKKNAEKYWEL